MVGMQHAPVSPWRGQRAWTSAGPRRSSSRARTALAPGLPPRQLHGLGFAPPHTTISPTLSSPHGGRDLRLEFAQPLDPNAALHAATSAASRAIEALELSKTHAVSADDFDEAKRLHDQIAAAKLELTGAQAPLADTGQRGRSTSAAPTVSGRANDPVVSASRAMEHVYEPPLGRVPWHCRATVV